MNNLNLVDDQPTALQMAEAWVVNYGDYLFAFAFMHLRDRDLAEDAVQETFLAAHKARNRFKGRSSVKTWLTGILKHKIIDAFRKTYREKSVTDMMSEHQVTEEFFDLALHFKKAPIHWPSDPYIMMENQDFWIVCNDCINRLPKKVAQAFVLREIEGHTGSEICEIMNITQRAFWALMYRARLRLRECLEKNWFEADGV